MPALCRIYSKSADDPEKLMKSRPNKTPSCIVAAFAVAITALGIGMETSVQAQTANADDTASMVKPPVAPSAPNAAGPRADNPDNMPTKRPALPPNSDRMLHNNPASDAIAK